MRNCFCMWQVSDNDGYPKVICSNCKCQLDLLTKFIDDMLDGQLFLENLYKMCKSKQFSSDELPLVVENTSSFKNNVNTKIANVEFICDTCGMTLAHINDFKMHLKCHGN